MTIYDIASSDGPTQGYGPCWHQFWQQINEGHPWQGKACGSDCGQDCQLLHSKSPYHTSKVLIADKADQDTHGVQAGHELACLHLKESAQVDILHLLKEHIGRNQGLTVNFYT